MAQEFQMWVHRGDKHNKFWTYDITGSSFTATYGRIGTPGTSKSKPFHSQYSAESHALDKIHEKIRKGYKKVSEEEYKMLEICAQAIGATNKVEHMGLVIDKGTELFEITPEAAFDPSIQPSILIVFRLRDKHGATDPFHMLLNGDSAYDLGSITKTSSYARRWNTKDKLYKNVVAIWKPHKRIKIGNSHKLAPVVAKAEQAVGHGLL